MSIDYTVLFTRLGKLVKQANIWLVEQATLMTQADSILDQFETRRDLVTTVQSTMQNNANSAASWIDKFTPIATGVLADLQSSLSAPRSDMATILPLLYTDMVANSKTVLLSTITSPAVTAGANNTGNGSLLASRISLLESIDQRAISETVAFVCTNDRYTGATAGGEKFSITGLPLTKPNDGISARGNGVGLVIPVINESGVNLVANGDLETFSVTNTPNSWTINFGVAGTTIFKESSMVHSGLASLRLHSNGVATELKLSQALTKLKPRTVYVITAWVRKNGSFGGSSNLSINLSGTGMTTVQLYNTDPSGLTTSFALKSLFIATGNVVPTDLKISIDWTAANAATSGAEVVIDDVAIAAPVEFGNTQYALVRGSVDFLFGDGFSVVTANDYAGVFQTYFGRFFDFQLPSSASPSISDSLAT